jgi:hypothetical protein
MDMQNLGPEYNPDWSERREICEREAASVKGQNKLSIVIAGSWMRMKKAVVVLIFERSATLLAEVMVGD